MKYVLIAVVVLYVLWWNLEYQEGTFTGTANVYVKDYNGYPEPLYAFMVWAGVKSGNAYTFLWWLGLVLTISTVPLFYRSFKVVPKWWHGVLFIPAIAVLATRSSQGPAVFFVLLAYYLYKERFYFESACIATVAVFFRSELLLMPLLLGVVSRKEYLIVPIVAIGLWWGISGYPVKSNGMAVAYINLGFSSDNPYGLALSDSAADKTSREWGGKPDPWHRDNAKIFFWRYLAQVREHASYFVMDSFRKIARIFVTRLWVGEENMASWYSWAFKAGRVVLLMSLWVLFFARSKDVFINVFVLSHLVLAAFVGGTLIINGVYLLMLGSVME